MPEVIDKPAANAGSLRHSKKFQRILKSSESVHFDKKMLTAYAAAFPEMQARAVCANKIKDIEAGVVAKVVEELFAYYPFINIGYGKEKCIRDVSLVSVHMTHSMLMNDPEWLKDNLLHWMRTIIQAFGFPAEEAKPEQIATLSERKSLEIVVKKARAFPGHISSIYVTYTRLAQRYKALLSDEEWDLVKDQLQATIKILTKA